MARHFPRGRGARITRLVLGVALLSLTGTVLSPALGDREDELEQKQHELAAEVEGARDNLDASSNRLFRAGTALAEAQAQLSSARTRLADVRGQLDAARALDQQMRQRLAVAQRRLAEAEAELDASEQVVDDQQAEIERFAVEAYSGGDPGLISLGLVLGGQSPTEFTEMQSASESVVAAQTADLDSLDAARILLTLRQERVEELRDEVAVQRAEAAANLERKQELTAQARDQKAAVVELVQARRELRERAERAKEHDARVVERMERDQDRVEDMLAEIAARQERRAARQARQAARAEARQAAQEGADSAAPALPAPPTTTAEPGGFLSYPVASYVTSSYGMRLHPILGYVKLHDGTDFGAACGTPVRAAAAGTVVSQYYNAGYGNRVIMNHGLVGGVSLSTSYNHLTSFAVGSGAYVQRGQVIGYAGTTGYSTGCHLHFMVYEGGATVDPLGWL
ncbi:MAG: peptidoglycan DD-metalloendopeptidase family protein [Nocardioidaceae bacterium]|nr:peptidoglycan DD-metalloendopeptidase family protein [Nocardioidaceae bacterium]